MPTGHSWYLLRAIQCCIFANEPPSASIMKLKYTKAFTFSYSLRGVEPGRHLAKTFSLIHHHDFCFQFINTKSKFFFSGHLHLVDELRHFFFIWSDRGGFICISQIGDYSFPNRKHHQSNVLERCELYAHNRCWITEATLFIFEAPVAPLEKLQILHHQLSPP